MPKRTKTSGSRPSTPEAWQQELELMAYEKAKESLENGTATSQLITTLIKEGSTRKRLENEKLRLESELLKAKTESIKSNQRMENMFDEAIKAFGIYSGSEEDNEEDVYEYDEV